MGTYALLLRGVNVGGRSLLPMATLREVLQGLGYDGVQTYLQSGNAVVSTRRSAARLAGEVQEALRDALGRDVGVVVRTARQLAAVVDGWPFDADADAKCRHVVFFRTPGDAAVVREVGSDEWLPERWQLSGADLYLHLPDGMGRSRLAARLAGPLKRGGGTARNWNTVTALRDLTAAG